MRFLILGAGGLGGYFGGRLVRSGAGVGFLVRPRRAAQLAERKLVIKEPDGDFVIPVRTLTAGEIERKYDVVLLTCKAYDLESAAAAIAPAMGPGARSYRYSMASTRSTSSGSVLAANTCWAA